MKDKASSVIVGAADNNLTRWGYILHEQGYMRYRQSLMEYTEKYDVNRASRKYNKSRSYIYFWRARWNGTPESLAYVPGGPIVIPISMQKRTRLRFLAAYLEQSTYSSADFLNKLVKWYALQGIHVECPQTDHSPEFTNRFLSGKQNRPSLFEKTSAGPGIRHKLIRPYTPRHNGKVERSHREDQKRFYACHCLYSLDDFARQLAVHNRRSNSFPMRPLNYSSPSQFVVQYL